MYASVKAFKCHEAKKDKSEKAGSYKGVKPRTLWFEPPVRIENCGGLVVVWLLWLSVRALEAQARCPGSNSQRLPAFSPSSILPHNF